jgi:hypothetical protein
MLSSPLTWQDRTRSSASELIWAPENAIVVRLSQLIRQVDGSFVLVGAIKDVLKALPAFEYER